ncbi:acyl-coa-binding protein acbp [Holotrichia oblita]|uniref:Acyl-coa-binding protein acbp n=1 Tax=Holotrichia oblita TaxID=644536 RepID=A0ACB9TL17_HOLOL|nr:acyl-coa-binding protein acbp [Holotrichia oblita]
MTTEEKFNAAVNVIRGLPKNGSYQPSNELMLRFYSYFKQATEGPCKGPRPAFWEVVSRAKYDAWKRLGDMTKAEAMARYVEELHTIVETMSYSDKVANFLDAPSNEMDNISMADLQLVAGDVFEKVRSRSNSPLTSREPSPERIYSNSAGSSSPCPSTTDSDHSDGEYVDTIEAPEPKRLIPNGTAIPPPIVNGYVSKEHKPKSKPKTTMSHQIDISQEISAAVQSLKADIEALSLKISAIEKVRAQTLDRQVKKKHWLLDMQPQLIAFLIVWPFVASFIVNRFVNRKQL